MSIQDDRRPVIVGVGEITQHTKDPAQALEPLALMEVALREAERDAGGAGLLAGLDSIDVVSEYSWPYPDAPGQLSQRLGIDPARREYGEFGGESPVRFIHEAALRIRRGESNCAAVVGAEANYAAAAAAKLGIEPPWSPRDPHAKLVRGPDYLHPLSVRLGVATPATVYPFYENAAQAAWGQTPRQALDESGQIWARSSAVAAANPYAWQREALTADAIITPTPRNRLVAWPYTVRMVANPMVNQGAAVLVTSVANARAHGIADERMVHIWCGAAAAEPTDFLYRDRYDRSPSQEAVLERVLEQVGDVGVFQLTELYSCFPVVPKMARRTLALSANDTLTVAGGLSFFGAPLNNYMTHAAAALVRGLRARPEGLALLYGQGGYVTKHHALVLAPRAAPHDLLADDYGVQAGADRRRGPVPPLQLDHQGPAVLETHTVIYQRDSSPSHGVVLARTPTGGRVLARVAPEASSSIAALTDLDRSAVGRVGSVYLALAADDAIPHWEIEA